MDFPATTQELYAGFDFVGMTNGEEFHITWLLDGELLIERNAVWEHGSAGHAFERIAPNEGSLPTGQYEIVLFIAGEEIRRGFATVGIE